MASLRTIEDDYDARDILERFRLRHEGQRWQLSDYYRDYQRVADADELEAQPIITAKRKEEELTATEDKQHICSALAPVLRLTRHLDDLAYLRYDPKTEKVEATFLNGSVKKANVAADSGVAMIRDIIQQIV